MIKGEEIMEVLINDEYIQVVCCECGSRLTAWYEKSRDELMVEPCKDCIANLQEELMREFHRS